MKEVKSVSDDHEFKEVSGAVERCQLELIRVADRSAEVELQILNTQTTQPKDNGEWTQFVAGGVSDTSGRTQLNALREEQANLQQQHEFLDRSLEQGKAALDDPRACEIGSLQVLSR